MQRQPLFCQNLILPKTRTGLHKDLSVVVTTNGSVNLIWSERIQREVETLFLLENGSQSFIPTEYQKMLNTVFPMPQRVTTKVPILWTLVMPPEQLRTSILEFLKLSVESLNDLNLSYYVQHFRGHQSFLKKVLEHSEIQYDQLSTVTGRLVVKQGLDLLRVKREDRAQTLRNHNFKVNNSDYEFLYELDFKCLEPRVILATNTKGSDNFLVNVSDIYQAFQKKFLPTLTRAEAKQAIISKLYGKVGGEKQLEKIVEQEFHLSDFKEKLLTEEKQNKEKYGKPFILNGFGRRVSTTEALPYMLPVYYAQSTAVDVALKGFAQLLEKEERLKKTRILGLIHDALYVSSKTKLSLVAANEGLIVNLPEFPEVKFHVGIKEIN